MGDVLANTIYSGTSGGATYNLSGRLPSDGWGSFVVIRHAETQKIYTLAAVVVGEAFKVSYDSATSAAWDSGKYKVFTYAEKAGDKEICDESVTFIAVDPTGAVVKTADMVELEAVNKCIAGVLAGEGVQNYSFETAVGRRSADRMDLEALRKHKNHLERRIAADEAKAAGKPNPFGRRIIHAKFNR